MITKELNMVNLMKKERTINEEETRVSGHLDSKDDYIQVLIHRIKQSHTWHTVFICLQTDTGEWQWPLWQINLLSVQNFYNLKFTTT